MGRADVSVGPLERFSAWVSTRFGSRRENANSPPDYPDDGISADSPDDLRDLTQNGKAGAIPRKLLNAPNTYIIALGPVREKLGDHWNNYGPSVHRIANRLFSAAIAGAGSVQRYGDSYVIIFDKLQGQRVQAVGTQLQDQFMSLIYHGPDAPNSEETKSKEGSGPAGQKTSRIKRLWRAITNFFRTDNRTGFDTEAAGHDTEATATRSAPLKPIETPAIRKTPGSAAKAAKRKTTANNAEGNGKGTGGALADGHSSRGSMSDQKLLRRRKEARDLENAMMAEVLRRKMEWSKELENRPFPPPDLSFIYRSMWNLKTEHITTYTSVPVCWKNSMEILHGASVIPLPRRPENLYELDLLSLENGIEVLERGLDVENTALLMVGVHASTLADDTMLRDYLKLAGTIVESARENLIFEILDISDYAFQVEASKMVRALSTYGRAVTASIGFDDRNFAFWKQCGLMAVGVDLSTESRKEEEIVGIMGHFAAQAKRNKLQSYLRELDKRSQAIYAESSGFDFVEGSVIGSGSDTANLVLSEFSLENLYVQSDELDWAS